MVFDGAAGGGYFSWFFFHGSAVKTAPVYVFYGLFMLHYFNRIFIFLFAYAKTGNRCPG